MSITITSGLVEEQYIPISEKESENPTSFTLSPLDGMQYMEVIAELKRDEEGTFRISPKGLQFALKYGLKGWVNLTNNTGENIVFNEFNKRFLPARILAELANKIVDISELGESERKN